MKINVTLPFDNIADLEEFLRPEAVAEIGSVLERAGFDGEHGLQLGGGKLDGYVQKSRST